MSIVVLLEVEGRRKRLFLQDNRVESLRATFKSMCENDPVLKGRIKTHYATFSSYDSTFRKEIEVEDFDELEQAQVIKVYFAPYAVEPSEAATQNSEGSTGTTNAKDDIDYLNSIGIVVHDDESVDASASIAGCSNDVPGTSKKTINASASTAGCSNAIPGSSQKSNSKPSGSKGSQKSKSKNQNNKENEQSDSDDEYFNRALEKRRENRAALMDITKESRIVLTKRKTKQNKDENTAATRNQPLRAVKGSRPDKRPLEDDSPHEPDEPGEALEVDSGLFNTDKPNCEPENPPRRKPQRRVRMIGEKITRQTPLPPFPTDLVESLEKGLVYVSQTHTAKMNSFLTGFIESITNDLYPTVEENKIIVEKVIARLTAMGLDHLDFYEGRIKSSLSASLRNTRSWEQNKKPRYMAEKKLNAMAKSTRDKRFDVVLEAEEADEILRKPVKNKDSVLSALAAAKGLTPKTIRSLSVAVARDTFPYLKDPELLINDLGNRLELRVDQFEENFESSLVYLAKMLLVDTPEEELSKAKLWQQAYRHFEKSDGNFPCIQFNDFSARASEVLENIPRGQAPALILTVDDADIVSAIVVMNQEPLNTMMRPRAYESMALLLAPYFIYNVEYPSAYRKFLLTLEHILCGESKLCRIAREVKSFFKKFFEAKKLFQ